VLVSQDEEELVIALGLFFVVEYVDDGNADLVLLLIIEQLSVEWRQVFVSGVPDIHIGYHLVPRGTNRDLLSRTPIQRDHFEGILSLSLNYEDPFFE